MKKILKENKGFSLVELLIALLIMAVIAGTAITLFGGVLETSKGGADRETAESIKRAILTYINASNDTDLSAIGFRAGGTDADLISVLAHTITIEDTTATKSNGTTTSAISDAIVDPNDVKGTFGPFFEKTDIKPTQNGMKGWDISINKVTQIITVKASTTSGAITLTP